MEKQNESAVSELAKEITEACDGHLKICLTRLKAMGLIGVNRAVRADGQWFEVSIKPVFSEDIEKYPPAQVEKVAAPVPVAEVPPPVKRTTAARAKPPGDQTMNPPKTTEAFISAVTPSAAAAVVSVVSPESPSAESGAFLAAPVPPITGESGESGESEESQATDSE